ncbi:MAG: T9SS type B sorting domain-containing protein [Sphingobacteriales bacterium]|nr:MAG: T9SS type B sorting domain-containing protein [Sphingobacteriales bacterium]
MPRKYLIILKCIVCLLFITCMVIGNVYAQRPGLKNNRTYGNRVEFRLNKSDDSNLRKKNNDYFSSVINRVISTSNYKDVDNSKVFRVAGPVNLTITTANSTCGYTNGSIIIQATGGTPPYTFRVDSYTQNNGNFQNIYQGNHTVTVKDAAGNVTTTTVTITNTYNRATVAVSNYSGLVGCGSTNGVVTLAGSGGTPPYLYSIDAINYQTSNSFSNLSQGFYEFFIKDANGCLGFTIFNTFASCNRPLSLNASVAACTNEGFIDIRDNSANGPFLYSLDGINYQASGSFPNLGPSIYTIYIKDNSGNIATLGYVIFKSCVVIIDYAETDASCGQSDGSVSILVTNGSPPYTYTIDGINYQSSNTFTGLRPGNYTITAKDASGNLQSLLTTVVDKCPLVTAVSTGASCNTNDGTITATGNKGTPPYTYSIDGINFQTSKVFTGLAIGNYTITIKDANGFIATTTITVDDACLPFTYFANSSTCGNSNGSIVINVAGGTSPYLYSIDGVNFQTNNIFTGLSAANYKLTVKDATGKISSKNIALGNIAGPQINLTVIPASCSNMDGSVTVSQSGGTAGFFYSKDGINYQLNNVFGSLTGGNNYTFYVKDINGCIDSKSIVIPVDCPQVTAIPKDETCSSSNGSITAAGNSGTPPYQYSIDGINFQTSTLFNNLKAGNYTITVKDGPGYTNTVSVTVKNICPMVTATGVNGLCGTANATITAVGANGATPYEYSIDGINFQNINVFSNLPNGTYTITVKDAAGLKNTTQVTVTNFPSPTLTATAVNASCLNNDGKITLTASGGTPPLQYSVDGVNYQAGNIFTNKASGNYTAIVKDANGCAAQKAISVGLTDNLSLSTTGDKTICEGTGVIISGISNGTAFNWFPAAGLNNTAIINPSASPLVSTKYYLIAALGICAKKDSVTVNVNPAPVADAGADVTVCYGQSIQLNGSGGVQYQWTPATYLSNSSIQKPTVTKPLNTTVYSLQVTDAKGCKSLNNETVTVTVTPMAQVFAGNDTSIAIGEPLPLNAMDVNNSGFSSYSWSPAYGLSNTGIPNPVATTDRDIKYVVTAITPQGCEGRDDIVIKVFKAPEIFVPNVFTPNGDGTNDVVKAIPVGIKQFKYFMIYNRWGQQVFKTADASMGWDGKLKGQDQNMQLFTWMAEGIDFKGNKIFRKGIVVLLR